MASARSYEPASAEQNSLRRRVALVLGLSLPYLVLGWLAYSRAFMSDEHARLVSNALVTVDRGRTELIGFVYPPLPFILLLPWPHPLAATLLTAVMGGAVVLILWEQIQSTPFPLPARLALVAAIAAAPSGMFVMTQSLVETLALLLLVYAWSSFLEFVREGNTRSGFASGLALGGALFVSQYALFYAALYVMLAPALLANRQPNAEVSIALVLLFPVVVSGGTWAYVSWAFTGDALRFLRDAGSTLYSGGLIGVDSLVMGWPLALRSTLLDLAASPLYLVVGLVIAVLRPFRLPVLLLPVAVITTVRVLGLAYPDHFAVATYGVTALIALRPDTPRRLWPVLTLAALLQVAAGFVLPMQGEMAIWREAVTSSRIVDGGLEEREIGVKLAGLAPHGVLADDRIAYRIIASTGTARPFILPPDGGYKLAESQPAIFVPYLLVPSQPMYAATDRVGLLYPEEKPAGFEDMATWSRWKLYSRPVAPNSSTIAVPAPSEPSPPWWERLASRLSELVLISRQPL